ncbi:MAG: ester cyclase [Pseudomonadota bacterium]|nr:MAG: hypothetical protein DIU78_00635 [Pseudomonadota bacterium]
MVVGLTGCAAQQPSTEPLAPPPPAEPPAAALPESTEEVPAEPPPPPELTAEQKLERYKECWAAFNAKDSTKVAACYAENATFELVDGGDAALAGRSAILQNDLEPPFAAFPDASAESLLTLQNGDRIASLAFMRGTHQGTLKTSRGELAPTNKKIALTVGHVVELAGGSVQRHLEYADQRTVLVQLGVLQGTARKPVEPPAGERPVVVASNADTEKANVETFQKLTAAFNAHDAAAFEALLADDVVLSEASAAADRVGRKEVLKGQKEIWQGMSDSKIEHTSVWGAGDYVVATGTFTGTNDGPLPSWKVWNKTGKPVTLGLLEIAKLEGGKVKQHWVFTNGLAFAQQLGILPPEKKPAAAKSAPAATPAQPMSDVSSATGTQSQAPKVAPPAAPPRPAAQ